MTLYMYQNYYIKQKIGYFVVSRGMSLQAVEMNYFRKILVIKRIDKERNEGIRVEREIKLLRNKLEDKN